jgi:hypothetical protein
MNSSSESSETLTKEQCLICFSEYSVIKFRLRCKCNVCHECVYNWIKASNADNTHIETEFINCPMYSCKKEISKDWLYCSLPTRYLNDLNEIFMKKYLNSSSDIKKCPISGCTYSGYLEKFNKCSKEYECDLCKNKWKDSDNTNKSLVMNILSYGNPFQVVNSFFEELSEMRIKVLTSQCYHCNRNIHKFEGCNHITCICKKEFCYNCLGDYHNHDTNRCTNLYEIKGIGFILMFISFILKFTLAFGFTKLLIYYIIFYPIYYTYIGICYPFRNIWTITCWIFNFTYPFTLGLFISFTKIVFFFFYDLFLESMIKFLLKFIGINFGVCIMFFVIYQFNKLVLRTCIRYYNNQKILTLAFIISIVELIAGFYFLQDLHPIISMVPQYLFDEIILIFKAFIVSVGLYIIWLIAYTVLNKINQVLKKIR